MVFENAINRLVFVGRALLAFLLLMPALARAQGGYQVDISQNATIYAHPNSSINIFSDLTHRGTFVSYATAQINFRGASWRNEGESRLLDESPTGVSAVGGMFSFFGQNPAAIQTIVTAAPKPFNGFPNLQINNPSNVMAVSGDLYVHNELNFRRGNLILNGVNITVGQNGSGTISGFGPTGFIVTGTTGGSLIRSFSGTDITSKVYPVGSSVSSYTPAAIIYRGNPQVIRLRVDDGVFEKPEFPEYVYKTWIVERENPDASGSMDLSLQHNAIDEGLVYTRSRNDAYVSRYDPGLVGLYDIVGPQATTPGTLTGTPGAVPNAYLNTRLNIGGLKATERFTKSVITKHIDPNTPKNIPDAISPNSDGMNDTYMIEKRVATDKVRFEVYTRNHVPVYQHLDYDNSFDGTGNLGGFLGNVLPDGIYYYLISVNGAKGIAGYLIINR